MEDGIEQYRSMLLDLNERKKKTDEKKEIDKKTEPDKKTETDKKTELINYLPEYSKQSATTLFYIFIGINLFIIIIRGFSFI